MYNFLLVLTRIIAYFYIDDNLASE